MVTPTALPPRPARQVRWTLKTWVIFLAIMLPVLAGGAWMALAAVLAPEGATSQGAPANVLETISASHLEAGHAIVLTPSSPSERAAVMVKADALGTRLEAEGFGAALLESPKLVRLKGGAVPGAKGSGGLMWAVVVDQSPGLSGTVDRPFTPSKGATGTYLIVFLSAETGDFVMAFGGETFGR